MIKFDERSVVRTTCEIGTRVDTAEASRVLWNIFFTTKDFNRRETLILRDPRLPVAIIHAKGSISISGGHSLLYSCKCLKVIANMLGKLKASPQWHGDTSQLSRKWLFRVNYVSGRFRIQSQVEKPPARLPVTSESGSANYETIQKWMDISSAPQPTETGWNINLIDILLSKNYDWCVKHGVEQVFSTKKASKKYELEMNIRSEKSPGAATIVLRMNERGAFRYTMLLARKEFEMGGEGDVVDSTEAAAVQTLQEEIDAARVHLNAFVSAFYSDILVQCQKRKVDLSGMA